MKDYRKFCRPKTTKYPLVGDVLVKLNCGSIVYVKAKDYYSIKKSFKINSIVGETSNTVGNIKVLDKKFNKEITISPEDYVNNLDKFELIEIVGEKKDPFGLYEYVDLGLPSGTLWCKTNVGANTEGAIGNYYKYGETTVYDGSDYNTSEYYDVYDPDIPLPREYDAANANQGGDWHIPTRAQWNELINNTTHTYISNYNNTGVSVIKFEKTNDSSIFILIPTGGSYTDGVLKLPENAYYWSQTTNHYGSVYYALLTENSYFFVDWSTAFGHGQLVRAVCDSVDSLGLAEEGDIICHNSLSNQDAIFSYSDWLNLDDSWDATGLYGIKTFDDDDEVTEERKVIMSNGTTFIIKSTDYSSVSSHWEVVDTISVPGPPTIDGHEYVEIGGIKWATMNIGATAITDTGLYFQWGDTQGYTAAQVGNGEGQKNFGEEDCIYYNNGSYTKYNEGDSRIILESTDDAATVNMGSGWRMPTTAEFETLGEAVTTSWTADYQGSGVAGLICTDKTDNSKVLFFPAAGNCINGSVSNVGSYGNYWSSSLSTSNVIYGRYLNFNSGDCYTDDFDRYYGFSVRGVVDSN